MILIYSEQITNRLVYTLELIFQSVLKTGFQLTGDKDGFLASALPKINYSNEDFGDGLFLKAHSLLFETGITEQKIAPFVFKKQWCFFPVSGNSFLPFDVFACSFYITTRYEEYLDEGAGPHGRFPVDKSLQYKYKVLDEPLVNYWARLLADRITESYPEFSVPEKKFHFCMTIDVDNAWAYKNKPLWVQTGGLLKSLLKADFLEIKSRLRVLSGKEADPYDTYPFIEKLFEGKEDRLRFFFLLGNRSPYDRNISHRNRKLQQLIRRLAGKYEIGIHPSYLSNGNKKLVEKEKQRIETILGEPVMSSRQHFLRLNLPATYESLISAGITDDFTLGWADAVGFRAGLCTPFQFFNLKENKAMPLIVHPLHAMDVALKDYLKLEPERALNELILLMQKVKSIGGTFTGLWHNESLSGRGTWKGWQDVFQQLTAMGLKFENE
ncbi:MAG: polysaccharide deacetylase family protein [Prolixibacteraceae bacterium]|jgi:hypothetical protein|nr:polysaccharide deacetylase family protein [Prolixibacteraceae bacterium]